MTRLVRKITLFAMCGLLTAGVAMADVPDPANSGCRNVGAEGLGLPCQSIYVVGDNGAGVVDPVGEFCVTVRDFNNVPVQFSSVVLDFSECDVQLCTDQLDPLVIVDCISQTVRKLTDSNGAACFRVRGKSRSAGSLGCGGAIKDCVKVFADGVLLCSLDAPTYDLVSQGGEDGLNPNDLREFLRIYLVCRTNPGRGNYACGDQKLNPNDLSFFLRVLLVSQGSTANCAGAKDPQFGPKCP